MPKLIDFILRAALGACIVFTIGAGAAPKRELVAGSFPDLRKSQDASLQRGLESSLNRLDLLNAVRDKRLAVTVVDITNLQHPRVASVNGDVMLYAASLPKIAILLGAFVEIERGNMKLDEETRDTLIQMVRVSSNEAATAMLRRVGKENLISILTSPRFKLYDTRYNGGLWVGKEYGDAPAYQRDPLHNLSHGATAMQVARFYYMLETGQLVNPELSHQMKEILGNPGIHHKFVKGLEDTGARIFRKSGTWAQWHADSAIVERDGKRYIIVGLAEDPNGGQWLVDLVKPVDAMIIPTHYASRDTSIASSIPDPQTEALTLVSASSKPAHMDEEDDASVEARARTAFASLNISGLNLKHSDEKLLTACARDTTHSRKAVVLCR